MKTNQLPPSKFAGMRASLAGVDRAVAALAITQPDSHVPGLPAGLKVVRFGAPGHNELFLDMGGLRRADCSPGGKYPPTLVVEPLPGWDARFDFANGRWRLFQTFPKPRKLLATIEVNNSAEEADAAAALNAIPGLKALSSLP